MKLIKKIKEFRKFYKLKNKWEYFQKATIAYDELHDVIKSGLDLDLIKDLLPGEIYFVKNGKWFLKTSTGDYPVLSILEPELDMILGFIERTKANSGDIDDIVETLYNEADNFYELKPKQSLLDKYPSAIIEMLSSKFEKVCEGCTYCWGEVDLRYIDLIWVPLTKKVRK